MDRSDVGEVVLDEAGKSLQRLVLFFCLEVAPSGAGWLSWCVPLLVVA